MGSLAAEYVLFVKGYKGLYTLVNGKRYFPHRACDISEGIVKVESIIDKEKYGFIKGRNITPDEIGSCVDIVNVLSIGDFNGYGVSVHKYLSEYPVLYRKNRFSFYIVVTGELKCVLSGTNSKVPEGHHWELMYDHSFGDASLFITSHSENFSNTQEYLDAVRKRVLATWGTLQPLPTDKDELFELVLPVVGRGSDVIEVIDGKVVKLRDCSEYAYTYTEDRYYALSSEGNFVRIDVASYAKDVYEHVDITKDIIDRAIDMNMAIRADSYICDPKEDVPDDVLIVERSVWYGDEKVISVPFFKSGLFTWERYNRVKGVLDKGQSDLNSFRKSIAKRLSSDAAIRVLRETSTKEFQKYFWAR